MRKLLLCLVILALCGCEVIKEEDRLIPVEPTPQNSTSTGRRHVLLEYTGFRCVNCPTASELAQTLEHTYAGRLYLVSLHPASNPFTQGIAKYDYTCPEADSIYQWMGGTASTPFPKGNVDMLPYQDEYMHNPSEWTTMIYNAMQDTVIPAIDSKISYWIIEDSILGAQAMPDGSVNTAYYHRHVLRATYDTKEDIVLSDKWNTEQLFLLTLYLDPIDNHIINAYETKFMDDSSYGAKY